MARPVDELMREDHVGRRVGLLHRSHRARGEDRVDAEGLKAEDIGAVVDLVRQRAMSAAMPRQKRDANAVDVADDERVGRIAERRSDAALFDDAEAFHFVETRTADDTDRCFAHRFTLSRASRGITGGTATSETSSLLLR